METRAGCALEPGRTALPEERLDGARSRTRPQLAELFEAYRKPIFKLCLNLTGNRTDAEDALQASFLAIYEALPSFSGGSKLSTWMFRIALRMALRSKGKNRQLDAVPADSTADTPADPVSRRETSEVLARAMGQLSAEHRMVLSLFAIEELSHREIAELLGIPEGTVWSRLHVARKKLVAELKERGYFREDL